MAQVDYAVCSCMYTQRGVKEFLMQLSSGPRGQVCIALDGNRDSHLLELVHSSQSKLLYTMRPELPLIELKGVSVSLSPCVMKEYAQTRSFHHMSYDCMVIFWDTNSYKASG